MKKNKVSMMITVLILIFQVALIPSAQAAAITGKIAFEGTAPASPPMAMDADPNCQMMHPDGVSADDVIVNPNGTLKNVFVYVKEGLGDQTFEAPKEPVAFNQQGCQYHPKVFGIQVGQPLEILNSDNTLHNVHAVPTKSTQFNLGMPIQGMKLKKTFTAPEVMVKIKCDVHPWMAAYAGVLKHPFFGVSGDEGTFEIKNLVPGQYVIEAWHEKYGTQTFSVTISSADETKDIAFTFKAS